ncbi:AraC family transcriptional regulator [Nodosilinea nodulosa]|uniref:AraC family transcriptional regulator n=1 Tax=Nodosilinea nodulosa TaxID=416001 RepID=UPI00031245BA|nr:AraC family transcriptional regulator [Nodosilinea nodulosa]
MQSQITYVDSDTLTPNSEITAGRILVSSQDLAWDGLYIEKGENEGFTPDDVTVTQHYFAMNAGPAFDWEWKDGSTFKTHRYETGDLWVNPAGTPFSHRISGYNQFVLLTLDPNKILELRPDVQGPALKGQRPLLAQPYFRRQHQAQDRHLQALIQTLLVEAEMGGPNGRLFADTLTTAIATHFVNHYSLDTPVWPQLSPIERQRLGRVMDYIEAYLTDDLTLADLALQAGLSKFHFSRLFKDATGLTPHKYVQQRRIERAAQVLLRREGAIAAVAADFGFADQSHFTRVFKQVKGLTPKQFLHHSR